MTARLGRTIVAAVLLALLACAEAHAAFPGQNGKIAFTSFRDGSGRGEIFVMNPDGTGQTNITNFPSASDVNAAWSPDGSRIAFQSNRAGQDDIYRMNADGSSVTRLTEDPSNDFFPAWSPHATQIAFTSNRVPSSDVFVMGADGNDAVNLTLTPGSDAAPAWSPSGASIAFMSQRDGNFEIYSMSPDGTGQVNLTLNPGFDETPNWSPDGSMIAFASSRDGNSEVYVMRADGSEQRRLTHESAFDGHPAWSPDGMKIAFMSSRLGNQDIYVMNADGSGQTRLTTHAAFDQKPDWAPYVDTDPPAPPVLTATDPASPANWNQPAVLGSAEADSSVRLYANAGCTGTPAATGSAAQLASGLTATVADDTTTAFHATATDAGGNTSGCSAPISYVEDSTAPQTTIDSAPSSPTNDSTPTFRFSAGEPASFECSVDGGVFRSCASPHTTETLADGTHTFAVAATDVAGNRDPTPASVTFTVQPSCSLVRLPLPLGLGTLCVVEQRS